MGIYGFLFCLMGSYGGYRSLWGYYKLFILTSFYRFLGVFTGSFELLLVLTGFYEFLGVLCVLKCSNGSLWVFMGPYVSSSVLIGP